jgi:hypothetical protein
MKPKRIFLVKPNIIILGRDFLRTYQVSRLAHGNKKQSLLELLFYKRHNYPYYRAGQAITEPGG